MSYEDPFKSIETLKLSSSSNTISPDYQPPAWLQPDLGELEDVYGRVGANTNKRLGSIAAGVNRTINYNTTVGGQAANNAAKEYTARQGQSGGDASAAGVVKAQALLPILQMNADVRTRGQEKASDIRGDALRMSATIAGQLASLRTSYAGTLANFVTQGRSLDLQEKSLEQQKASERLKAIQLGMAAPKPIGSYQTDNYGGVASGRNFYDEQENWKQSQANFLSELQSYGI